MASGFSPWRSNHHSSVESYQLELSSEQQKVEEGIEIEVQTWGLITRNSTLFTLRTQKKITDTRKVSAIHPSLLGGLEFSQLFALGSIYMVGATTKSASVLPKHIV